MKSVVTQAVPQALPAKAAPAHVAAPSKVLSEAAASVDGVKKSGMILELGLTFTLVHYQHIFQSVMRGLFQSFRPLIILYVFSHIFKAMFFLGFMFIGMYYNNRYFARVRPTVTAMFRQQKQ